MFENLLTANRRFAAEFALGDLAGRAAQGLAVVTCMDTRLEPLAILGLSPGDAKILRNGGGRVTPDVLRSLVLAAAFLGVTHVAVMHHTKCALAGTNEEEVRSALRSALGSALEPELMTGAADWDFLTMPDPDLALMNDVEAIRTCRVLPEALAVEGWRYDVQTGVVDRVVPSGSR